MIGATIIDVPSSTENESGGRDPELHQTRKGNQPYSGMTGHFGVDNRASLIRSVGG